MIEGLTSGDFFSWKVDPWTGFCIDGTDCEGLKMFAIDPATIRTGWGKIQRGAAPEWTWDEDKPNPSPGPDWKRGFEVQVYVTEKGGACITGWKPWSSNQASALAAMNNLFNTQGIHDKFKENSGKIAQIRYDGSQPGNKTKIPILTFVKWVNQPNGLNGSGAPAPSPTPPPEPIKQSIPPTAPVAETDDDLF